MLELNYMLDRLELNLQRTFYVYTFDGVCNRLIIYDYIDIEKDIFDMHTIFIDAGIELIYIEFKKRFHVEIKDTYFRLCNQYFLRKKESHDKQN